jgi:hypothetical protein
MKTIKCYRWVKEDMTSENGKMSWKLKKWNKVDGELKLCANGLHAYTCPLESIKNRFGDKWFIAEAKGKSINDETKICCSEMRLVKEIPDMVFKRFALFCAKDCLKNYETEYPKDKRVSDCIKATEDYLDGKIKIDELNAAESAAESAWSATWSAAESAAESAARSARSAAWSAAESAWSAAWSAAESAAESAARSARSAAWSAAEERQKKELLRLIEEYT